MRSRVPFRWLSLPEAATARSVAAATLRKALDRRAKRVGGGVVEAVAFGLRGRKLGGRWRVTLGEIWQEPRDSYRPRDAAAILGMSVGAVRKLIERYLGRGSWVQGMRALKLSGAGWRIVFGRGWTAVRDSGGLPSCPT